MDNQERQLLESALDLLHKLCGYADAKDAFRPLLRMESHVIPFPEKQEKEKSELGSSDEKRGLIEFTEKEILSMPKEKRNYFRIDGVRAHWRKKPNGVYEIRCTINKILYYGASRDLKVARQRFLADLRKEKVQVVAPTATVARLPLDVGRYTLHYLEVFKKPNVAENTYTTYFNAARAHIIGKIGNVPISDVNASDCQKLLKDLLDEGKGRTAEIVFNLLSWIFEAAFSDRLIVSNPMTAVRIPKHYRTPGQQIPAELVREYLEREPTSRYDYLIRFLLFTGVRPGEMKSAVFEDGFVMIKNGKQRKGAPPTFRRIPLHAALLPFLEGLKIYVKTTTCVSEIGRQFKERFPKQYRLYDCRHTFTSRAQECGANKAWIDYVTNHVAAQNVTDRVYTHWSDKFHLSEIKKLEF